MPLLRKPVLMPIVGVNYMDPSTMISDRGGFPQNMRLYRNDLRKREGISLFQTAAMVGANAVLYLTEYNLVSQATRLVRFSKIGVEKYNTATGAWDVITGSAFTGTVDDFFSSCVAEDKLIMTNYIDAIRTYNDAGNTADLVASSGSVPKAKFLEYNGGYLLAAYLNTGTAFPTKVGWTDTGDITDWGSGNYGSALLYHDPLPIRGMKNLNEFTIVYKKNSIYNGRKVDTSDVFTFDLTHTGVGLISNRCLVDYRGAHYFMGTDDFYSYKGVRPESIGEATVKRQVFSRLSPANSKRSFAVLATDYDEIWFYVAISGNDWPTEVWKYNYRTGYWYYDTCSGITAAGTYVEGATFAWNDLVGTWNAQNYRWDDKLSSADAPIIILGDSAGKTLKYDSLVNNDNGVAIDGQWQSMDFAADSFETYKRWLQLDFEAKGYSIEISYSTDYGSTWKTIKASYTLSDDWPTIPYRVYFDVVARNIRFRFRNNTSGETFFLRQFYPYYLSREETNR
jgi:hypothetical protein